MKTLTSGGPPISVYRKDREIGGLRLDASHLARMPTLGLDESCPSNASGVRWIAVWVFCPNPPRMHFCKNVRSHMLVTLALRDGTASFKRHNVWIKKKNKIRKKTRGKQRYLPHTKSTKTLIWVLWAEWSIVGFEFLSCLVLFLKVICVGLCFNSWCLFLSYFQLNSKFSKLSVSDDQSWSPKFQEWSVLMSLFLVWSIVRDFQRTTAFALARHQLLSRRLVGHWYDQAFLTDFKKLRGILNLHVSVQVGAQVWW